MDSSILQTVIGLVFAFAAFSVLVSVLTEAAARYIGLRGEYLLRGIRSLVDGESRFELRLPDLLRRTSRAPAVAEGEPALPMVTRIVEQPMVSRSADKGTLPANAGNAKLSAKDRRAIPSYVSGRSFARALIGVLVPEGTGRTTLDDVRAEIERLEPKNPLRQPLLGLLAEAGDDLAAFRDNVEQWYDDHMARVSGWYKRHVRWISLAFAAVVVVVFNVNVVGMARALYTDEALRDAVVAQAVTTSDCASKTPDACLAELRDQVPTALPLGWSQAPGCESGNCSWLDRHALTDPNRGLVGDLTTFALVLLGWALMALSTLPGARFWFDTLSRLNTLRSTGPKPSSS
ncbi:hypothetical protein HPO96_29440 [Kribbella sandramycini]|uniref:Uncharacterized protein n=1 Tax=Kribbella sandramycini TaxID=60450 RepID=A0A7Y4L4S4_9ACTN|nr:hypothetical protein [Kribbella sandramycini]MBB6571735.1 hypothetical protein [Kribbella sandramycini]NOL44378.1 hypothetical protein [Kribbella sandramycini]